MAVSGAAGAVGAWAKGRANRRSVARFGEFWSALQRVGDVLAEAERLSKSGDKGKNRNARHWDIATVDEVRNSLRRCQSSLRIVSSAAKKFEPELIVKDWRR